MLIPRTMLLRLGGTVPLDDRRREWLGHCEGFQVRDLDGHRATVQHLCFGSRRDVPDALALGFGPLGLRRRLVAANRIIRVSPQDGTITVAGCLCGDNHRRPTERAPRQSRPALRLG